MKAHELWLQKFGKPLDRVAQPQGGPWEEGWVHPSSLDTYKGVANWVGDEICFSKSVQWQNTSIVGMIADFVVSYIQGDILEIGCGVSSIYLTAVSKKYHRKISYCDIESSKILNPLTVPGYMNEDGTFYLCSSDDMFAKKELNPLAFCFIDGDHHYEQVRKDFWNVVPLMVDNGYIMLHDTYPPTEEYVDHNLCGDVYKLRQEIDKDDRFDVLTLVGYGSYVACTLVRVKPKNQPYYQE